MYDHEFCVSLRLRHPSRNLEEFTELLGLTPSNMWTAGGPRYTRKGRLIQEQARDSHWTARVSGEGNLQSTEIDMADFLAKVTKDLAPHKEKFAEFTSSGGKVEYFIGCFGNDNIMAGFGTDLLRELVDLNISLCFDIYVDEPEDTRK